MTRTEQINQAIRHSQSSVPFNRCVIYEENNRREFFRFIHGELVEYDLTKFDGRAVRLTKQEKQLAEAFNCFPESGN